MLHRNILALLLLMMTGAALADTKTLYFMGSTHNDYCIGSHTGTLFKTPQQAQQSCGMQKYDIVGPHKNGNYGFAREGVEWFTLYAMTKSCELKDLTTDADREFDFKDGAKEGMYRRCHDNCEVEYREMEGGQGSVCSPLGCVAQYTALQTGAVCVAKPGKKDDEETNYDTVDGEHDDGGNGGNGSGNDGTGTETGSGNGGQGNPANGNQGGKDKSEGTGDSGTADSNSEGKQGGTGSAGKGNSGGANGDGDTVGDKDDEADKDKPGKGKGKGGGGGGNHGDKDKDDKDKADDDKAGDPKGGEGKGDGKGDGKDGGKDGKDDQSGSPNGTDNGTGAGGDKDGQGSGISGGDCKSGKAPSCKGDPVQCYIAREQWRTACLAERGGGTVSGGSCKNNQPPECKGDPTQCYIVKQQFYQGCEAARAQQERDGMKDYVGGKGGVVAEVDGSSMDGVGKTLAGNSKEQNITDILDLGGYGWSRSCPTIAAVDMGKWGRFELDGAPACTIANLIGNILVALSLLFSVRYMFA